MSLYLTPLGYTSKRPATLPPIDRAALMRAAHRIAKRFKDAMGSYRKALAHGLRTAWRQFQLARQIRSLNAQVTRRDYTPQERAASRCATRRCGASFT